MLFNAVLFVWNEADIIEATIRNLFCQGVDNIYVIDNGSTDNTVELAARAGARLAQPVVSRYFEERIKYTAINALIAAVNAASDEARIWWIIVDADEFPESGLGIPLRDLLLRCPPGVRLIPAIVPNHAPTHQPYYVSGYHPADFQPCIVGSDADKLPLLRYDKGSSHIMTMGGAHTYSNPDGYLTGLDHKIRLHHFKFRTPEQTASRLRALLDQREDGTRRVDRIDIYGQTFHNQRSDYWNRLEGLDALYRDNANRHIRQFNPDWSTRNLSRWYALDDIRLPASLSLCDQWLCRGSALLYHGDPVAALEAFSEVARYCADRPTEDSAEAVLRDAVCLCRQLLRAEH